MFSCEFSKISKDTFFTEHFRTTASVFSFPERASRGILWKKVFLKNSQNSKFNLVCEILKNTFFIEHFWTTASAFIFSEAVTGGVPWKKVFLKISKNSQENTFGLRSFQKHHFYRTTLDDCFWIFRATLRKWGNANKNGVFGKPQMNIRYLETLTLEVPFGYIISFFGRINFQCMFSLVYTVYCEKQLLE